MKTQLIKLSDYNIIVSNEEVKENDWCLNPNNDVEVFGYDYRAAYSREVILNCKKLIASDNSEHNLPSIDYSNVITTLYDPILNKPLPEFLYQDDDTIRIDRHGDSDVTKEWNEYIQSLKDTPKVFDIEIKVESKPENGWAIAINEEIWIEKLIPHVFNNSIKILKIL